jgi:hypothetical protein
MANNPEGSKLTQLDIAQLITRSWNQLQHSTILNTWQSIGIHPFNKNKLIVVMRGGGHVKQ